MNGGEHTLNEGGASLLFFQAFFIAKLRIHPANFGGMLTKYISHVNLGKSSWKASEEVRVREPVAHLFPGIGLVPQY